MIKYRIIEDLDETDPPKPHEKRVARIIAESTKSDIRFIRRQIGRSADIEILNIREIWEIKSPTGNSKRTIDNNLRDASDQSKNVILDLSRTKMHTNNVISRAKNFTNGKWCRLKKLKIITKTGQIIDILS